MTDGHDAISQVIIGWDALWLSTVLFILIYAVVISERVNRAIVAGLGAGLMITTGVLNQQQAIAGVDFNTLGRVVSR